MIALLTKRFRNRGDTMNRRIADLKNAQTEEGEARYKPIDLKMLRRLIQQLKPYKKLYTIGVCLGATQLLLDQLSPLYTGKLVDLTTNFDRSLPNAASTATHRLILLILLWTGTTLIAVILQRFTILVMTGAGESVQFDTRRKVFAKLQELSMSYYDKTKLGRIISRCTSDIGSLREVNVWGLTLVVNNSMAMAIAAGMMLYTDWRLFLSVAWLGPVLFFLNVFYLKRASKMTQVVREGFTKVSTNLAENITGMRVVTAFNRQEPNLDAFNELQEMNTENNVSLAKLNGIYQPMLQAIGYLGKVILLCVSAYLIMTGRIGGEVGGPTRAGVVSLGAVVAAFGYWDWFMGPILTFGTFYNQLMVAMAGAERVFDLLATNAEVYDLADAKPLPRIEGDVEFQHVTFGYNPERPVLHDVSFHAHAGETYALVGATGSGKSSIVSLIARFYQPQQGKVLVDGRDIRHVTGDSLHKQMGLVLQVNYLFGGTVMENIRYSKPTATDAEIIEAAKAIGSHATIESLQNGYQTDVGERGANMSLGQRQLICFTRAFLSDPRVFMLDEATSAVDTSTELLVQDSLEKLLQGRTTFIVAHRLSTILKATCILVIDAGRIVEQGTHRELLAKNGKYAQLYNQFAHHAAA